MYYVIVKNTDPGIAKNLHIFSPLIAQSVFKTPYFLLSVCVYVCIYKWMVARLSSDWAVPQTSITFALQEFNHHRSVAGASEYFVYKNMSPLNNTWIKF